MCPNLKVLENVARHLKTHLKDDVAFVSARFLDIRINLALILEAN
jgi:hypothetical protein